MDSIGTPRSAGAVAEINVTPLIDVMLVLLIIFMVTAPLLSRDVRFALPQGDPRVVDRPEPQPVRLRVDSAGAVFWDDRRVERHQLDYLLKTAAAAEPPAQIVLSSSDEARYEAMAELMASARNAGISRIGFAPAP